MDIEKFVPEQDSNDETVDYQLEYNKILRTELSPENFSSYTETAFDKLSNLIEQALSEIDSSKITSDLSTAELEDLAMAKLNLPNIGETLEKISKIQDQIAFCTQSVATAKAHPAPKIFLPTVNSNVDVKRAPAIKANSPKTPKPNTAAALLLLTQKFEVEPQDIFIAHSNDNPRNNDSDYNLISIEPLHRTILISDAAAHNHTFVFNTNHFAENDLDDNKITDLSKVELERLLKQHPEIGCRIRYSKLFLSNLENAIIDPSGHLDLDQKPQTYLGLDEIPPAGYLTKNNIAEATGRDISTVYQVAKDAPDIFGEVRHYSKNGQDIIFYSPEQISYIKHELDKIPDDSYITIGTFSHQHHNVDVKTIKAFLAKHTDAPGEIVNITRGKQHYMYLSPEKVQYIEDNLPALQAIMPEEGDITIPKFAESLGVDHKALGKFILSLGIEPVKRYKKSAGERPHLTPEQQEYILDNIGDKPPEGTITLAQFAKQNNVDIGTVRRAAARIDLDFPRYRWMKREFDHVSPDMQEKLITEIKNSPKNNGLKNQ